MCMCHEMCVGNAEWGVDLASPSTVTLPTEAVALNPVTDAMASPFTVTLPTPPVAATPVTSTGPRASSLAKGDTENPVIPNISVS